MSGGMRFGYTGRIKKMFWDDDHDDDGMMMMMMMMKMMTLVVMIMMMKQHVYTCVGLRYCAGDMRTVLVSVRLQKVQHVKNLKACVISRLFW